MPARQMCLAVLMSLAAVPCLATDIDLNKDGKTSTAELAKAAQNPVASMISLPFQNDTNFNFGPEEKTQNVLNIQPVWPISLNEKWNVITRTIVPIISQPEFTPDGDRTNGLGDTTFTAFLSPKDSGKLIWGVGPAILIPTATDDDLGSDEWGAGPSVVFLTMPGHWVIGSLFSNVWSFGGSGSDKVNIFTWQPFVNYNMDRGWYLDLIADHHRELGGEQRRHVDRAARRRLRPYLPGRQAGDERAVPGLLQRGEAGVWLRLGFAAAIPVVISEVAAAMPDNQAPGVRSGRAV